MPEPTRAELQARIDELTRQLDAATTDATLNAELVAVQAERDALTESLRDVTEERDQLLAAGAVLPAPSTVAPDLRDRQVIVGPGDTLDSIAQAAGVDADELLRVNRRTLDDEAIARGAVQAEVLNREGERVAVSMFPGTTLVLPERK